MQTERKSDRTLAVIALSLTALGAIMVYSSTAVSSMATSGVDYSVLRRHMVTLAVGLVSLVVCSAVDYRIFQRIAVPLLAVSAVVLALVFVPGIGAKINGSRRWLRFGVFSFQPSELIKFALIVFLARYLSTPPNSPHRSSVAALREKIEDPVRGVLVPLAVVGVFQGVLLLQPDFGSVVILGLLAVGMLYGSGARPRHLLALLPLAVLAVGVLLREPYRMRRIIAFTNPWKYADREGYQLIQSLLSFGSGGWTGVGVGEGSQKLYFLPEPHTDFIFSMVGEELGFFGAVTVVALFAWFLVRGMRIARGAPDRFGEILAMGLTVGIALQAFLNCAVATGMAPTKGLPLPFISYGGSCMVVSLASVGVLMNISKSSLKRIPVAGVRRPALRRPVPEGRI